MFSWVIRVKNEQLRRQRWEVSWNILSSLRIFHIFFFERNLWWWCLYSHFICRLDVRRDFPGLLQTWLNLTRIPVPRPGKSAGSKIVSTVFWWFISLCAYTLTLTPHRQPWHGYLVTPSHAKCSPFTDFSRDIALLDILALSCRLEKEKGWERGKEQPWEVRCGAGAFHKLLYPTSPGP